MEGNGRSYEIQGKKLTPEDVHEISKEISDLQLKSKEKYPREVDKSIEQLQDITTANKLLASAIEKLGFTARTITTEQIHLVDSAFLDEMEGKKNETRNGQASIIDDQIFILTDRQTSLNTHDKSWLRLNFVKLAIHELIHLQGYQKFFADKDQQGFASRSGYGTPSMRRQTILLNSLNEAVVDKLALEIIKENPNLPEDLGRKKKPTDSLYKLLEQESGYIFFIGILEIIIEKIATVEKKTEDEIWTEFKINHFSGKLMFLRRIEKIFGKGSLEVLSAMDRSNTSEVRTYFSTDDQAQQDKVKNIILNPSVRRNA